MSAMQGASTWTILSIEGRVRRKRSLLVSWRLPQKQERTSFRDVFAAEGVQERECVVTRRWTISGGCHVRLFRGVELSLVPWQEAWIASCYRGYWTRFVFWGPLLGLTWRDITIWGLIGFVWRRTGWLGLRFLWCITVSETELRLDAPRIL